LHALYRQAVQRYETIDSYIARLRRREKVNGKDNGEELLLFKFRKQPFSVYFKWVGTRAHGREVVYVKGRYGDQIHTLTASGDIPFTAAGTHMALAPDNIFVRANSRHSITEAGIGNIIERYGAVLHALDRGDVRQGTATYLGAVQRPEFATAVEAVEQSIPPGLEAQLPRGGKYTVMFDPASRLPVLLITRDETGSEVEYYCYDRIQFPVKLDDDDFNPDKLWVPRR
jgi:hypothetical protein